MSVVLFKQWVKTNMAAVVMGQCIRVPDVNICASSELIRALRGLLPAGLQSAQSCQLQPDQPVFTRVSVCETFCSALHFRVCIITDHIYYSTYQIGCVILWVCDQLPVCF